jgi:hypothetical protein
MISFDFSEKSKDIGYLFLFFEIDDNAIMKN